MGWEFPIMAAPWSKKNPDTFLTITFEPILWLWFWFWAIFIQITIGLSVIVYLNICDDIYHSVIEILARSLPFIGLFFSYSARGVLLSDFTACWPTLRAALLPRSRDHTRPLKPAVLTRRARWARRGGFGNAGPGLHGGSHGYWPLGPRSMFEQVFCMQHAPSSLRSHSAESGWHSAWRPVVWTSLWDAGHIELGTTFVWFWWALDRFYPMRISILWFDINLGRRPL